MPVDGIPVVETKFGEITGLPEEKEGIYYIVSTIILNEGKKLGRKDLISPDTGPTAIRVAGQVTTVKRFQR